MHAQSARRGELTVTNPTSDARPSETITLSAGELQRVLGPGNLQLIHVRDDRSVDLLTQALDVDDDGTFDELIFQVDGWFLAKRIREFVDAAERAFIEVHGGFDPDSEAAEWIRWARQQAEMVDPLRRMP